MKSMGEVVISETGERVNSAEIGEVRNFESMTKKAKKLFGKEKFNIF